MTTATPKTQLEQMLEMIPTMPAEKLVKLYIKTRTAKAELKKVFDAQVAQADAIMDCAQNVMLKKADADGVTGFTTEFGTTYAAETKRISIADDKAFFDFVRDKGDLDFFERRVSSKHVENYMALNEGAAPPGLNFFRERVMRVRKAGEK